MEKWTKNIGFSLVLIYSSMVFSQKINVRNTVGYCQTNELIPLKTVKKCALEKALLNAYEKAGIALELQSTFIENTTSTTDSIIQKNAFFEIQSKYANATITNYKRVKYKEKDGYIYAYVGKVSLLKHKTTIDPSFTFYTQGLKSYYKHLEPLTFSIQPNQNGYLTIFYVEADTAYKLYPSPEENDAFLKKAQTYDFPRNPYLDYTLEASDIRTNTLVFIFTKSDIFFSEQMPEKALYQKIYSLEQNQRYFAFHPIKIEH